jgi:polyisoprenoid-binding protein YceI
MKLLGTILLMLLAAAVAAVITYLAISNQRLREAVALREAADRAAQLAAAQQAGMQTPQPTPLPWRPTRITGAAPQPNGSAPAPLVVAPERPANSASAGAPAPGPRPGSVVTVPGPPLVIAGGNWVRYTALPGSKVRIEGTSSLHPWEVNGSIIGGSLEVLAAQTGAGAYKATVKLPVRTLKSYQKKMDEVMQETMEMARFPGIDYQLIKLELIGRVEEGKDSMAYEATGALTVHGTTVTNTMPVSIESLDGAAKLKVTGASPLKMTDFGIKPVDVNLGIGHITTGDEVTVSFEWLVGREK